MSADPNLLLARPAVDTGSIASVSHADAARTATSALESTTDAVRTSRARTDHERTAHERTPRWVGAVLPVSLLLALEAASRLDWIAPHLLPPPSEVLNTLWWLMGQGLAGHVVASTLRVLAGFALGASSALLIGSLVGLSHRGERFLDPTFQALRAIPSLAWVPLLLLWLGIDEAPKIVLIAIGAFFPVYMGVASGFRDVDRKLVEVARMAGLSSLALIRRVMLPAAMPALLTGMRNGLSLAWMFMVAAELIAATKGLGYLLTDGRETSRADIVLAAIVLLALLGKITDTAIQSLERHLLAWRDTFDSESR